MSRLPPELARRIDRLSRRAHAFHRFAHHPLCEAYQLEVIRVGRKIRICRGCALAGAGSLSGLLVGLLIPPPPAAALVAGAVLFALVCFAALAARASKSRSKLTTRFAPAFFGGGVVSAGLGAHHLLGTGCALSAVAAIAVASWAYRRRGPDRDPCLTCPERYHSETCSGLRPIVHREAAFRRLAGRWIERDTSGSAGRAPGGQSI